MKDFWILIKEFIWNKPYSKKVDYSFRKPKDGYLVFKKQFDPKIRRFLIFIRDLIKLIIDKKKKNDEINREILKSLDVNPDSKISSLDAVYKKEFRKQKYAQKVERKEFKYVSEPISKSFGFFEFSSKTTNDGNTSKFFEFFGGNNPNSEDKDKS